MNLLNALGFGVSVHDEVSARYAIKMSGLPVFLQGLTILVPSLLSLIYKNYVLSGIGISIGFCVCFLAILIRRGNTSVIPFTSALVLISTIAFMILVTPFISLPMVMGIGLILSGMKGLKWLERNA